MPIRRVRILSVVRELSGGRGPVLLVFEMALVDIGKDIDGLAVPTF